MCHPALAISVGKTLQIYKINQYFVILDKEKLKYY